MTDQDHQLQGALDTVLGFDDALTAVEVKTGELFHKLERQRVEVEPLYEIFRLFSEIRFQMAEAHEYQTLLHARTGRKGRGKGANGHAQPAKGATEAPVVPPPVVNGHSKPMDGSLVSMLMTPYVFCGNTLRALIGTR